MNHSEYIASLISLVKGLASLLGSDTEVVLHDLETFKIVYIANGYVTGRSIEYKTNPLVYQTIFSSADADGNMIAYRSHSVSGKELRSTHLVLRNSAGKPLALICINQDTEKLMELRSFIDSMIESHAVSKEDTEQTNENYIQNVTRSLIFDEIEKMKPTRLDTKDAKLQLLRILETKGVFTVKDAIPTVCSLLSISQATLYNYLRELRTKTELLPFKPLEL